MLRGILLLVIIGAIMSCREDIPEIITSKPIFVGADLSYTNEMEDCGGIFRDNGVSVDPFELFASKGANLIRLRLWHDPSGWTDYSNLEDVKKSISRAKNEGMSVLLDFHYSDFWADPGRQEIPTAWSSATTKEELGDLLYDYTYNTLSDLHAEDLLPTIVQIGNEINSGLLHWPDHTGMDWTSTIYYLQKGLLAVADFENETGESIETMIHIAQPENALWWFPQAFTNGLGSFDWIGLSYYPAWSDYSLTELPDRLKEIRNTFQRNVLIVETAYPYTLTNIDQAPNILGQDGLLSSYPASATGQKNYLFDLVDAVREGEAKGLIYWEPTWISTDCSSFWAQGSHWDNATFFDAQNQNEALPAFEFLKH